MSHHYFDTFIAVAEDTKATTATVPEPRAGKKTVAMMQYEMLSQPFKYTQEQVLFDVWLERQGEAGKIDVEALSKDEIEKIRNDFFAKGQACLRASALTKTYGWGVIFDTQGCAALVAMDSDEYQTHLTNPDIKVLKGMRSKRA